MVLNRLDIGGTSINTIPLIQLLQKNFIIRVLYGKEDSSENAISYFTYEYPAVSFTSLKHLKKKNNLFSFLSAYREIKKKLVDFEPDIIHTHGSIAGIAGRLCAKNKVPFIVHTYHGHFFHSYFSNLVTTTVIRLEKFLASFTNSVIVLSQQQKKDIVETYNITSKKNAVIIPLGIPHTYFSQEPDYKRQAFREKYNLSKNTIAIGLIGRLAAIKDPLFFVKVCIALKKETTIGLAFFIVGDGELMQPLQQYLQNLNIPFCSPSQSHNNPLFIFTSWYTSIAEVHHGLDIVALTSHNEGTPLSLIEAQYCSKPVVAANVGGVRDAVIDGTSGFLIEEADEAAFVQRLKLLVENEPLRNEMGIKAHQFISENFSMEKQAQQTTNLYNRLLKNIEAIS